ncbi:MAG: ArnT family glycosyltransferase [Segniliparus sp.]|uniref:ArnT family glycosyltransferase n=1 Tax=Segniliparus sp. TaxID=2804064 RepID=UPI003F364581
MSGAGNQVRRIDRRAWLLVALLLGTFGTYLVNLGRNGWSNAFYAAAAQAGSQSWTAFLFGASDAPGTITVDKPPFALWPMALSVKLFGLSSWSLLVPQALIGTASVGLLYLVVRRSFGSDAGLVAGLVLALTPIAMVMFRHNNPDAMLVLLEIAATGAMLEAVRAERASRSAWWLLACGSLMGFAFLTKQLAAFLILPGLALVWLVSAKPGLLKRAGLSFVALAGLVVSAGWWVALVELWRPKDSRPWVGGSEVNSFLDLTFGYNGIGRLTGDAFHNFGRGEPGGEECGGGFAKKGPFGLPPGLDRMFSDWVGGQIGWLIPAAAVLLVLGWALVWRSPRTDARKAGLIAWGGWFVVTLLVFSYMKDTFHPYYSVALAPAIAALVGAGLVLAWERRDSLRVRLALALAALATAAAGWTILGHTPDWLPWLRWALLVAGAVVAVGLLPLSERTKPAVWFAAAAGLAVVGLAGPVAYAFPDLSRPIAGGMPSAGPSDPMSGLFAGMGEGAGQSPGQGAGSAEGSSCGPKRREGGRSPFDERTDPALIAALRQDAGRYTWAAAGVSAMGTAQYQLDSGLPVMPVGGFSGRDPWPTLAVFQQLVAEGKIHYFLAPADSDPADKDDETESGKIAAWAEGRFEPQTFGDEKLYDLTKPKG